MRTLDQKNQRDVRYATISQELRNQQYYDQVVMPLSIDEPKEEDGRDMRHQLKWAGTQKHKPKEIPE